MNFFPQPCPALPESPKLRAKQGHAKSTTFAKDFSDLKNNSFRLYPDSVGALREPSPTPHAKSAKRGCFSALSFLKFRIPRVSASRNRGAHFAFPNKIPPSRLYPDSVGAWRPLREQSAFSLTEVVIAMGVAAVAFTSIIALFPLGLNMSKESYEATQAALIAQTILADVKDQQTGNGNQRVSSSPWNTKLIQIASNSDPINVLTNYATVMIDQLTPQIVYIAYKPFVGTGNDTDTNNPAMLRPSTGIYAAAAPNWYSTGSNGVSMLVKVTFSPTIMLGSANSTSTPRRVDVSVETPGSANISNRTCYLFTGAVRP